MIARVRPTKTTQPYRRGVRPFVGRRQPGSALAAMLRGRPAYLPNPMDARRQAMKKRRGR